MKPYYQDNWTTLFNGDCRDVLSSLPAESVNCVVTSPPYFGLRDYGVDGQVGLESSPDAYIQSLVEIFRDIRRVIHPDATVWLNLGDTFSAGGRGHDTPKQKSNKGSGIGVIAGRWSVDGMKPKQLLMIPHRVAIALQMDGWYVRMDVVWAKPNPMPESVTDRPTKSHEYIFLLTKAERYFYNADAIKESAIAGISKRNGERVPQGNVDSRGVGRYTAASKFGCNDNTRNKRSVWTVSTKPYADAHFAVFPADLIRPCILAGCPVGGVVLDPFAGSGTTLQVAMEQGCKSIGIELNPEYCKLITNRMRQPMMNFEQAG